MRNQPAAPGHYERGQELGPGELARLRQGAYRLLSQCLLYPDAERLASLAAVARELGGPSHVPGPALQSLPRACRGSGGRAALTGDPDPWAGFSFFPQWRRLLAALQGLIGQDPSTIQATYISTFLVAQELVPCPPVESAYLPDSLDGAGALLARLQGEYARAGLAPSPTFREPPDHIAVELEFMSLLCGREADAWADRDLRGAQDALQRQRSFLDTHLARWAPAFRRRVADVDGRLFATVAETLAIFISHDRDLSLALLALCPSVRRSGAGADG